MAWRNRPESITTKSIVLVGTAPNPDHDPRSDASRAEHQKVVALDVAGGGIATYDLTERSVEGSAHYD